MRAGRDAENELGAGVTLVTPRAEATLAITRAVRYVLPIALDRGDDRPSGWGNNMEGADGVRNSGVAGSRVFRRAHDGNWWKLP